MRNFSILIVIVVAVAMTALKVNADTTTYATLVLYNRVDGTCDSSTGNVVFDTQYSVGACIPESVYFITGGSPAILAAKITAFDDTTGIANLTYFSDMSCTSTIGTANDDTYYPSVGTIVGCRDFTANGYGSSIKDAKIFCTNVTSVATNGVTVTEASASTGATCADGTPVFHSLNSCFPSTAVTGASYAKVQSCETGYGTVTVSW